MSRRRPKVTFGMIVLNGEPFIRHNLRALYPYAHQIIVVEGACPSANAVATLDGHSRDKTLDTVREFQRNEDIAQKVRLVTAEDDGRPSGFWNEKDEMSQAYAKRSTGDYLWQIDVDEFYLPGDIECVLDMLADDPGISAVSFPVHTFWGNPGTTVESSFLRRTSFHRLFAWKPGYVYATHRPPTVVDEQGRDLRAIKHVSVSEMMVRGIFLYHYELLFPKQVIEKCSYYRDATWTTHLRQLDRWVSECYFQLRHPLRMHMEYSTLSWLRRFDGEHPPEGLAMYAEVARGAYERIGVRDMADADRLLERMWYRGLTWCLSAAIFTFLRLRTLVRAGSRARLHSRQSAASCSAR